MAYTKHIWVAPQGTNLNRMKKLNETAASVDLVQDPTLTNTPTPFSVEWMNQMEQGIFDAHTDIKNNFNTLNSHADTVDGQGRNLLTVLGVSTIADAMAALAIFCNGTGIPDFSKLRIGDYLDGIDLSAIPAENGGDAGQAWNSQYLNNRIIISGFNTFKYFGDNGLNEGLNHILFTFRNIPLRKKMRSENINTGGYHASELRAFLDGTIGDGSGNYEGDAKVTTGAFFKALKGQIGNRILRILRLLDESTFGVNEICDFHYYSVFLLSEYEVFGSNVYGRPTCDHTKIQYPIYQSSNTYRRKRFNGVGSSFWLCTPPAQYNHNFCHVETKGYCAFKGPASLSGCSPSFCIY